MFIEHHRHSKDMKDIQENMGAIKTPQHQSAQSSSFDANQIAALVAQQALWNHVDFPRNIWY